jgi:hypothetical protein
MFPCSQIIPKSPIAGINHKVECVPHKGSGHQMDPVCPRDIG